MNNWSPVPESNGALRFFRPSQRPRLLTGVTSQARRSIISMEGDAGFEPAASEVEAPRSGPDELIALVDLPGLEPGSTD
jgi:hypothetical protein